MRVPFAEGVFSSSHCCGLHCCPLVASVPENYDRLYKSYAAQGARVIALASRSLPEAETDPVATLKAMTREEVEANMVWEGFAVFQVRSAVDKEISASRPNLTFFAPHTFLPPSVPSRRRASRLSRSWWTRATRS